MDDGSSAVCEYELACAEALLAGTLALMTGYAQSHCPQCRGRMAGKVVSNLGALTQQPTTSPQFLAALRGLREHWCRLADESVPGPAAAGNAAAGRLH